MYKNKQRAEIIRSWGFSAENYEVVTEDGYKLSIVRGYATKTKKHPVVIGHGFTGNGYQWLFKGNRSIGYVLGEMGYEFWLPNYRGSKLSRGHTYLTDKNKTYWDFSFHEMAIYDLPAILNKVSEISKSEKSIFVGLSMSTTVSYIFATRKKEIAEKRLLRIVSLAPIAYMGHIKSFVKYLTPFDSLLKLSYVTNYHGELIPLLRPVGHLCSLTPGLILLCDFFAGFVAGFNFGNIDPSVSPLVAVMLYDGSSVKAALHNSQLIKTGKFAEYDYGKKKNLVIYGSAKPPVYDFKSISVPVTIFEGERDWLAVKSASLRIYDELKPEVRCGFTIVPGYTHFDFLRAIDIEKKFYPQVGHSLETNCIQNKLT